MQCKMRWCKPCRASFWRRAWLNRGPSPQMVSVTSSCCAKAPLSTTEIPVTSGDVQFSFERYRGALASEMKSRVASVETDGSRHVRFNLKQPWPDFLMLYTMVTGAGWVVPKKYLLAVGDEGFKKAPIGAGPY